MEPHGEAWPQNMEKKTLLVEFVFFFLWKGGLGRWSGYLDNKGKELEP